MKTLLKILTMPIWLPLKILWGISKFIAFIMMILLLALLAYLVIHFL